MSISPEQSIAAKSSVVAELESDRTGLPGPATTEMMAVPKADRDGWVQPPPVTLSDGTRVRLHKDGEALHAAYNAIREARRRVCLEVYIFHSDATGRAFADLLSQKARQGLRVFLIYDSFGSFETDPAVFAQMRKAGVRMRSFHPLKPWDCKFGWRPLNRDHRKLLVIDDDVAGMGGLNVGSEYAGSSIITSETTDNWRDSAIGLAGPAAAMLFQSFRKTWHYIEHGGKIGKAELIHNIDQGEFGLLASVPSIDSPLRPFLHRLFREARKSIHLTMAYFAPDDLLVEDLCLASRRGVKVRLMLPGTSDVALLQIAARSFYETLLNSGVQIYERKGSMLHAKTICIDSATTVIGSTNLDYRSIEYNLELSAVIRSGEFGKQMIDLFKSDVEHASQITLERWRYRPTWDRIVQWAVSRARYLL